MTYDDSDDDDNRENNQLEFYETNKQYNKTYLLRVGKILEAIGVNLENKELDDVVNEPAIHNHPSLIQDFIKTGMDTKTPSSQFMLCSPTDAALILSVNLARQKQFNAEYSTVFQNRTLRTVYVNLYVRDMSSGNWSVSNDAISFDTNGLLLNGQHRLNAIIQSETTQMFNFAVGLPHDSFSKHDTGRTRTPVDALSIKGTKNSHNAHSACKWLLNFDYFYSKNGSMRVALPKRTNEDILKCEARHPELPSAILVIKSCLKNGAIAPFGVLASCYYLFREKNETQAEAFFKTLAGHDANVHWALQCRNKMLQWSAHRPPGGAFRDNDCARLLVTAWNKMRSNETITKLMFKKDGRLPRIL
jgi:hypothetical protein